MKPFSRRTALRAGGISLSLPYLEAMNPSTAMAQSAVAAMPPRMAFLCYGIGMNMFEFFPKGEGNGAEMSRILRPVEDFKGRMTAFSGTYSEHGGGHAGDYVLLTGGKGHTPSGIVNNISVDQIAAKHLGQNTRFPSLQFSIKRGTGFGSQICTLSWSERGIPLAAECDPYVIFKKLFAVDNARERRDRDEDFRLRGSILDAVNSQAKRMEAKVSQGDRNKLDEYFTSVREVEKQLQRNIDWSGTPKPNPDLPDIGDYSKPMHLHQTGFEYETWLKLMFDLMVMSFQTDSTRVITFMVRTEGGEIAECHGVTKGYHALTHHNNDPQNLSDLAKVDEVNMGFFNHLLQRLDSVKEADGKSLLDRTMLAYSSGMGIDHSRDRLPTALFGGSGLGVNHQTHVALPENTPIANVWKTMLDRANVPVPGEFQNATGIIEKVVS